MGQSGFMVKKQNLPPLLSFSALLVCILPHCRLRDWRGNLRKVSGHVVCRLDQSASFRIFDSTFYFPHSAFRNSAFYPCLRRAQYALGTLACVRIGKRKKLYVLMLHLYFVNKNVTLIFENCSIFALIIAIDLILLRSLQFT